MTTGCGDCRMRTKARLTITLPKDLLKQVDRQIDGQSIRNRSHAIETLVRRSLTPVVTTAAILAGGRDIDGENPALRPVQDRKLIHIMVSHLVEYGIRNLVILAGKQEEQFRQALGDGSGSGTIIQYAEETLPLGTAGALKAAASYLDQGPFLVVHGDVLTDINLSDFVNFHNNENRLATIAVKPRSAEPKYGKVMLQGNRITDFYDEDRSEGISIINTGVYLFEPEVLSLLVEGQPAKLENDVFPRLALMGELSAFLFQGIWFDISEPDDYARAQERWQRERRY
jgi:mannose-1-phosphate guanylyltransferase/phosphomannomutase